MASPDFSAVRAVFFDLDDTLCAYWDAAATGLKRTFEQVPCGERSTEEMVSHWAAAFRPFSKSIKPGPWYEGYLKFGEPTRIEQMRLTLLEAGIDDPSLAKRLSDVYFLERDRALALFPESLSVLSSLSERFPLGLITNGPADIQNQEIDTLGIRRFFQHFLIEGEMGEGKPLLSVFRRAETMCGFSGEQVLFVGNSYNHDIHPAIEAGWRTVWVRRASDVPPSAKGETNEPEAIPADGRPMPDLIVGDLSGLAGLLEY